MSPGEANRGASLAIASSFCFLEGTKLGVVPVFLKMKNKINLLAFVVALTLMATAIPWSAHAAPSEIPVLTQYVGYSDLFFASSGAGIVTTASDAYNGNRSGDWSNVLVAVTGSRPRKIRSLTEVWTDTSGRPHSLSVMKLQVEYNDALAAQDYVLGRPSRKVDGLVLESGVLDRQTLAIPYTKLNARASHLGKKVDYERHSAEALFPVDPGAATEREQFCSYVLEKLRDAWSKLALLRAAVDAVPFTQTSYIPERRVQVAGWDGLRGLDFVWVGLRSTNQDKSGEDRYYSGTRDTPELSIKEFVDPAGMTPAVVSDLLEKEAAAAKAVGVAENLFNDLFTPP